MKNGINMRQKKVVENDSWKILQDFTIRTDHFTEARRPDMDNR